MLSGSVSSIILLMAARWTPASTATMQFFSHFDATARTRREVVLSSKGPPPEPCVSLATSDLAGWSLKLCCVRPWGADEVPRHISFVPRWLSTCVRRHPRTPSSRSSLLDKVQKENHRWHWTDWYPHCRGRSLRDFPRRHLGKIRDRYAGGPRAGEVEMVGSMTSATSIRQGVMRTRTATIGVEAQRKN